MSAYVGGGLALGVAVLILVALGPVLRALPPPPEDPPDYGALATRRFVGITALLALVAGLIVAVRVAQPWLWLPLIAILLPACAIDARTTFLPLRLTQAAWLATGTCVATAAILTHDPGIVVRAMLGAGLLGVAFYVAWRARAVGFGDVRLMISVGAITAATSLALLLSGILAGTLLGAAWGVARVVARRGHGPFAYGPALLAGPFVALAVGAM